MTTPLTIFGSDCVLWCAADLSCLIGTTPKASGASPPAVTWATNLTRTDVPCIICDASGTVLTSTFKWSLDGGSTFQNTRLSAAATVTAMTAAGAPIPTFPVGTYTLNNRWDARCNIFTDQAVTPHSFQNSTQTNHPELLYAAQNGLRAFQWDGAASQLTSTLALPKPSTQQAYIFGVVRQDAGNAGGLYGMSGQSGWSLRRQGASPGINTDNFTGAVNNALTVGVFARIEVAVSIAAPLLNCFSTITPGGSVDVALSGGLLLGFAFGSGFGAVTWGEIGIVNRAATRSERDQLISYISVKWGLDTTGVVGTQTDLATNTQVPSVNRSFSIPGVSQAQLATAIKSIGMIRAASQAQTPTDAKQRAQTKATTQAQAPRLDRTLADRTTAQAQTPTTVKHYDAAANSAQTQIPTWIRDVGIPRDATQTQIPDMDRVRHNPSVDVEQTQIPDMDRVQARVISTLQGQLAFLGRAVFLGVEQMQTQTAAVLTLKTRIYEATQAQFPSVARVVFRPGAIYADLKVLVRPLVIDAAAASRKLYTDLRVLVRPIWAIVKGTIK